MRAGQPVRGDGAALHTLLTNASRAAVRVLRVRLRITGLEHLPARGPVLVAANHVSYVDFIAMAIAAARRRRRLYFLCRGAMWDHPASAWILDRLGHIPVDRAAPAAAYLRALALLERGEAVAIFPEAGISYSLTVRPVMRGVASLASRTGAPVVPVGVFGTQRIWGVWPLDEHGNELGLDRSRGRSVDLRFEEPFAVPRDADLTAVTVDLAHQLTRMLEEIQCEPRHVPQPDEHAPWYPAHLGGHGLSVAEASEWDSVPRSAITPTWGPGADDWAQEPPFETERG